MVVSSCPGAIYIIIYDHHFQTSLKPHGQSKPNFYVEPPLEGGKKDCINGPGHKTKMAAKPIYGKNLQKSTPTEFMKLGMDHYLHERYKFI